MLPKKLSIIFISVLLLALAGGVKAVSVGHSANFNIESNYDLDERDEISAILIKITSKLYFYAEQEWWSDLKYFQQNEIRKSISDLDKEFSSHIYPELTSIFGSEWNPGIDKDKRITILIHSMKEGVGSYFRTTDEYLKIQIPESNEREMIYLNTDFVDSDRAKMFLGHEFTHLITFNQKNKKHHAEEDVWLNEARAEYSATLLGYDDDFETSNLKSRLRAFLKSPSDSLTEWQGMPADYGVVNLFIQYLADHYGKEVLIDSLQSEKIGIESLNYALEKNGFEEDFSQIFTDWTITVVINKCSVDEKYCYKNQHLEHFRITPSVNFLPLEGESTLVATNMTKNWAGNWYKFVGGRGYLKVEFMSNLKNVFKIPYIIHDLSGNQTVDFFDVSEDSKAEILISDFGTEIISVTIIPSIQTKISDFLDEEETIAFFWSASTASAEKEILPEYLEKPILDMSKKEILEKINEIELVLQKLKDQLGKITSSDSDSYKKFDNDLFYGLMNNSEVFCLQDFLKSQGPEIYPEALITGNFLNLTRRAVIRFQEKYADEVLYPLNLEKGTGFVGVMTRKKINEILEY